LHYQCAPADQQSQVIRGGEPFRLLNLTPDGEWAATLPMLNIPVHLFSDEGKTEISPRLDTVIIEPDFRRIMLSLRASIPVQRTRAPLREVVLGHMEGAWLRAKAKGKRYWDIRGTGGLDPQRSYYL
jgi:hypothetical protein